LQRYAQTSYGVTLDTHAVEELSDAWFQRFPELRDFLARENELGELVAQFFILTLERHREHTDSSKFINHPANSGREQQPHTILGAMLLKVMGEQEPRTRDGRPYDSADIDFFWCVVKERINELPREAHRLVHQRQSSKKLKHIIMRVVDRRGV